MRAATRRVFIASLLLALGLVAHFLAFLGTPLRPPEKVLVEIEPGTGAWEISRTLEQRGVIADGPSFMAMAVVTGKARRLQAGMYVFEGSRTPLDIMHILFSGRTVTYRITVPEGFDIRQIADVVSKAGIVSRHEFLERAADPASAAFFGIEAPSMEGFLFPDTYFLVPRATPLEIMAKMVDRFRREYTPEMDRRASHLGMTRLEVVTLASLIEKEARNSHEKPVISSVFHNRLWRGMRLQSDPTAVYGLDGFTGRIRHEDLLRETPYNTYLHHGLPPGPICNPGSESIRAALWPADTDFLYFFARGDGTHVFSRTLPEHNRAITAERQQHRRG